MEDKDREILVGGNTFYLGEDNILYVTIVGEQDEKTPIALKGAIDKMKNIVEGRVDVLMDLNKSGKPSARGRKAGQEVLEDERIGKVAFFGLHPVARVIASFITGAVIKKDIHFFKTKEDALAWLKE